jgi:hypothetical protein
MLNRNKMWTLPAVLGVALLAATAAPQLRASGYNDDITSVTFSGPVDIGNISLAPGTYVFKTLPGFDTDKSLVEVMDQNNQYLIALLPSIPVAAPLDLSNSRIDLAEGPANAPERVKNWFVPGEYTGWQFLPPKAK